jgi:hypothetical protein
MEYLGGLPLTVRFVIRKDRRTQLRETFSQRAAVFVTESLFYLAQRR